MRTRGTASAILARIVSIVPGGANLGAYLVSHPQVHKVAFTGSMAVGQRIAEACARLLRPVSLELGGKSAAIILDDADLNLGAVGETLFSATILNDRQACFLGNAQFGPPRYEEVVGSFRYLVTSLHIGDAPEECTQIAAMVSAEHLSECNSTS